MLSATRLYLQLVASWQFSAESLQFCALFLAEFLAFFTFCIFCAFLLFWVEFWVFFMRILLSFAGFKAPVVGSMRRAAAGYAKAR